MGAAELLNAVAGQRGGAHHANRVIRSSSSDSMAQSHLEAPEWCCRNIVRFSRVHRVPHVA